MKTRPRSDLPLLGPGDPAAFRPGTPDYYTHVYGVTRDEAERFLDDLQMLQAQTETTRRDSSRRVA